MLDKKRKKKKTMYKKYIFKMFGMFFFCFCYVIWTAILVVVRPALFLKRKGGDIKSLTVSFLFFFFYFSSFLFAEMERLSSFNARENHWPSLFLFSSSVSRLSKKSISERCTVFAAHAV